MVPDTNTHRAAGLLQARGIELRRVVVVPDDLSLIAAELLLLSRRYDLVITSGGLGPTHDDVTLRAVAGALGVPFEESAEMQAIIDARMGEGAIDRATRRKMSLMPAGARLRPVPGQEAQSWPILQCANVFVLPGVPAFFEAKLATICEHFLAANARPLTRKLSLTVAEEAVVGALNAAVDAHAEVTFGSYPVSQGDVKTVVTLEAAAAAHAAIDSALAALVGALPHDCVACVSDAAELTEGGAPPTE